MSEQLSKEKMRDARLRALGVLPAATAGTAATADSSSSTVGAREAVEASDTKAEPISSSHSDAAASSAASCSLSSSSSCSVGMSNLSAIRDKMYMGGGATEEDLIRWYTQGFEFCEQPSFGLKQGSGGPCGILAATQAEILKKILFAESSTSAAAAAADFETLPELDESGQSNVLAYALCQILNRASNVTPPGGTLSSPASSTSIIQVVTMTAVAEAERAPFTCWTESDLLVHSFPAAASCSGSSLSSPPPSLLSSVESFLASPSVMSQYRSPYGCLLLLMSLMLSRGVEALATDMDDPSNTLIGQYGHCNQDLINLLLTGRATSNVMDGDVPLGDSGLTIKGIYNKSSTGYLSHLEALRYCEVGSFYKIPVFPVWVIGSSSHFSVLFCLDSSVNEESSAEHLQSTLQRCFKSADPDECGFIPSHRLRHVLELLHLEAEYASNPILELIKDETNVARMRGAMQVDGEIILWSAFWQNISKLMSGVLLDDLISIPIEIPPEYGAMDVLVDGVAVGGGKRPRSDSDLAREMQAELDGVGGGGGGGGFQQQQQQQLQPVASSAVASLNFDSLFNTVATAAPLLAPTQPHAATTAAAPSSSSSSSSTGLPRSDSDLARELQAQWEMDDAAAVAAVDEMNNAPPPLGGTMFNTPAVPTTTASASATIDLTDDNAHKSSASVQHSNCSSSSSSGTNRNNTSSSRKKKYTLYHFNGFASTGRSARLTKFEMIPNKCVDDVVGQSIAFGGSETGGSGSSSICPIEEVLRTRWQQCKIDWEGQPVPSID